MKLHKRIIVCLLTVLLIGQGNLWAQKKQYQVASVGFYNLENLFDTENDPQTRDEEFTPDGNNHWTNEKYQEKLFNMAHVISQMGKDVTNDGLSILGVAEIENCRVLEDLVKQPALKDRNYQIVHFDSPDKRGIDVGLLYNPSFFKVTNAKTVRYQPILGEGDTLFTRDQLLVSGLLNGEKVHVIVNHWPSRRGGEKRSRPLRNAAADVCRSIADSILKAEPEAKIMIMGDLNDDPINESVKKHINTKANKKEMETGFFYNPWENLYNKGIGTLAYRDSWNLFDQIILSDGLVNKNGEEFQFFKARIFKEKFMIEQEGRFKGYPKRTFSYGNYNGGYSDHFPVCIYLVKEAK